MNDKPKLARVMTSLITEPWLISPEMHAICFDIVRAHAMGGNEEALQHAAAAGMSAKQTNTDYQITDDGVAIVPVDGVLLRKVSAMWRSSGVSSVDGVQRAVEKAAADDTVRAIVLAVDSPGGVAMGTPEAAQAIKDAQSVSGKPVVAYVDGLAASAAYWIASSASAIYASPSSEVGSIGVYLALLDQSRAYAMVGLERVLIKSGTMKGAAYPGTEITAEQRAMFQEHVDKLGVKFRAAVASRRPKVQMEHMQGQTFDVEDGLSAGLIDNIGTLADAVRDALAMAK